MSTVLLIGAAIVGILGIIVFFQLRNQGNDVQKEIVSPTCGGPPVDRTFTAEQNGFTRVIVVPLALCGNNTTDASMIEIVSAEGVATPVTANEHRPRGTGRRDYTPGVGEMWLLAIPDGGKLRLRCPGGEIPDCRFLVAAVKQNVEGSIQLTPEATPIRAAACGDAGITRTGIYNLTRTSTDFEVVFDRVCTNGGNEVPPRLPQRSVEIGIPNGGERGTTRADGKWRFRGAVDRGNTIDVICPGATGGCSFHVFIRTTARSARQ